VAKGFVPALVATLAAGHVAGALAGGAAMLGHWRPIFLRFARGGKMVATCGGALFGLAPLVGLAGVLVWIAVFVVTRYASVASVLAAASLPFAALLLDEPWPVVVFSSAAAVGGVRPTPRESRPAPRGHRDESQAPAKARDDVLITRRCSCAPA
jgi:glycerol-3-phosphate acyltransferase PlsY